MPINGYGEKEKKNQKNARWRSDVTKGAIYDLHCSCITARSDVIPRSWSIARMENGTDIKIAAVTDALHRSREIRVTRKAWQDGIEHLASEMRDKRPRVHRDKAAFVLSAR